MDSEEDSAEYQCLAEDIVQDGKVSSSSEEHPLDEAFRKHLAHDHRNKNVARSYKGNGRTKQMEMLLAMDEEEQR